MMEQRKPTIVITGASKGIGLATAKVLLENFNAIVIAISRSRTPALAELADKHGTSLLLYDVDLTDEPSVKAALRNALEECQQVDGLILNAGTLDPLARIDSEASSAESWRRLFDINFFSLIYTIQAVLPALRESELVGKIIFVSSGAAVGGTPGWGAYNASKAALNSLCRTIAQEEPEIVSVAIRPGMVDTLMQAELRTRGAAHMREQDHNKFIQAYADGKLVKPEDAGHVIAALSVRAAMELSGQFVSWDSDHCKDYRRA